MLVQGRLAKATAMGKSLKFREFRLRAVHRRLLFSRGSQRFFGVQPIPRKWRTPNAH
jgi:hypothetical protein